MKIALASDIHLEFGDYKIENLEGADVLILSGDIMTDPMIGNDLTTKFFKQCSEKFPHVLYIAGNHEFYNGHLFKTREKIKNFVTQFKNVEFLDNTHYFINDVLFYGGTLWTNFDNENPLVMHTIRFSMNDYYKISNNNRKFAPEDALNEHKLFLAGLKDTLDKFKDHKTVVIGHHAPSKLSIHARYRDSKTNAAFSSDLSEFILSNPQIVLWTHGHTHDPFDYKIGETRIVANPRGYINYENIAYWFSLKFIDV